MRPLVWEKLNEFLEQGIIVPVEEPTDWVSSLAYTWKGNGKLSLFGSQRCQQSHQKRPLQDPHCWDHTSTGRKQEVYQGWWNLIISLHSPWLWIIPSHHLQYTTGKVQICMPPLGPIMCPGYLPKNDGPDSGMVQSSYWNCQWCHLWKWWWRPWPEPRHLQVQSPRTWSCVQWREVWS